MTDRMRKRFLITTLLAIACGFATFGRLIKTPINQAVTQTVRNVTMSCSSTFGSSSITWYLVPVGDSFNLTIASGSVVYSAFTELYWINQPTADESNLIISSLNDSSAGTFTCADNETVAHAQMIVGHYLIGSINVSNDLTVGDPITYSCELFYLGNLFFPPIFYLKRYYQNYWYDIEKTNSSEFGKQNSLNTATGFFHRTATCIYPQNLICFQQFELLVGNLLPGSATNIPYYSHNTVFPFAKVSCIPNITGAHSGAVLYYGAIITCYLNSTESTQPVNYAWTDLTDGTVSIGPQMIISYGGSYECNASYDLNGQWESVSATIYNLTVENLSITAKPLYGPIAGGTNVTITLENWSRQIANISAVYLGGILKTTSLQSDKLRSSVVITTPSAEIPLVGEPLGITIEFTPGPYNITTNFSFTYQGNPEITNISPSTFVFTGGTIVNVTGTQLSSVANPLIQVTLVVERGIERNTSTEKSIELCRVNAEDSSRMACPMPPVNIPDDFLEVLDSQSKNRRKRDKVSMSHLGSDDNPFMMSRGKRYANALSLTGPNGIDHAVIYLGFIFDGYEKYDNINDILPDTNIHIFSPPEISFTKDIIEFDPKKDDSISIKGMHMTRGCRIVDYEVEVGADICENIDLTDNELRCRPPKQQPQMTNKTSIYCDQLFGIYIRLGFQTYQYACMKYSARPSSTQTALIIGLAAGLSAFVIVVVLVITIVFCCKRSRNERSKPTSNTLSRNSNAPISGEHLETSAKSPTSEAYLRPAAMSHINEAYLQLSAMSHINEAYLQPSAHLYANEAHSQPSAHLYSNEPWSQPSAQLYANDD